LDNIEQLKEKLLQHRPVKWEFIPDIPLYMDQLKLYMMRQLIDLSEEDNLTSSMINNYSKMGILPRSQGKKYTKEHIAYLTGICLLKQVLPIKEVDTLIKTGIDDQVINDLYDVTLKILDEELNAVAKELPASKQKKDIMMSALQLAISSYTRQLACKELIKLLNEPDIIDDTKIDEES